LLVPYGATLVPIALSHWVMVGCDKYMIRELTTSPDPLAQIGFYSVGERISSMMQLVNMAFLLGWRRFAFRNMHLEDGPRLLSRGVTLFALTAGYGALGLILLGDDLVYWTMRRYAAGMHVIAPLTLSVMFWGFGEVMSVGLHKAQRTLLLAWLNVIAAILNVVLNFFLIPPFGIAGAAGATLVCQFLKSLLVWRSAQSAFRIPVEYRRLILAAGLFVGVYVAGRVLDSFGWTAATLSQTFLVVAVPVALYAGGFFRVEERRQIDRVLELLTGGRAALRLLRHSFAEPADGAEVKK
jgi:O-antigen/teichoic acid export membrane protein